ncbi:hypothetical protein EDD30_2206 [Couchioplanes caeruleus]|uniref:Uncharacterized protein n=1 Tax=Couchioplanes caeruleus TaxID=56438 RepID=A0A3N1GGK9_9ACTN|nr:hypothetical protein EDD30_2206 [Couchioplanes caeruleus]
MTAYAKRSADLAAEKRRRPRALVAPVIVTPTKPLTPRHVKGLLRVDVLHRAAALVTDVDSWNGATAAVLETLAPVQELALLDNGTICAATARRCVPGVHPTPRARRSRCGPRAAGRGRCRAEASGMPTAKTTSFASESCSPTDVEARSNDIQLACPHASTESAPLGPRARPRPRRRRLDLLVRSGAVGTDGRRCGHRSSCAWPGGSTVPVVRARKRSTATRASARRRSADAGGSPSRARICASLTTRP